MKISLIFFPIMNNVIRGALLRSPFFVFLTNSFCTFSSKVGIIRLYKSKEKCYDMGVEI